MKKQTPYLRFLITTTWVSVILFLAPLAYAQSDQDVQDLYTILGSFYKHLLLPIGTVLAGLVIIFGGIAYAASGGDPTKAQNAKSYIFGAISGLVLLILASLIIQTITK